MKHTKKLIPALGMLLLSACMLVTSTFAWFSMNENVTATGMTVKAKGDQVYLQIINETSTIDAEKVFKDGAAQTLATATLGSAEMLPVNVVNNRVETEVEGAKRYLTCTPYAGANTLVWVTNIGKDTQDGTASTDYTDVTAAANTNGKYYLKNTFKIRLDPTAGAESAEAALTISGINTSASADDFKGCLNVLVVSTINGTSMGQIWEYDTASDEFVKKTGAEALSANPFTAANPATVDIYVFFNGDDADCTQEKLAAATAANYDVEVQFTVAE